MFIRSSVLLRTWDLTSESRSAWCNLSWVKSSTSRIQETRWQLLYSVVIQYSRQKFMRREALALYSIGKIIPSGVLKTTVRLMIKSLFYRRKVGHETCEMDWKAVPRIEIAALWSGGLGRGVSTGGEGDAFLRWSGGTFGTSNLLWK